MCLKISGLTLYWEENLSINSFICCELNVGWGIGVEVGFGVCVGVSVGVGAGVGDSVREGEGEGEAERPCTFDVLPKK